jgi:hypothetical protein
MDMSWLEPLRPQLPGYPGCHDARIVAARDLLRRLEPSGCPPIERVRVLGMADADARCVRGTIFIDPTSAYYMRARSNPLPLAMLIHHEHYHAMHPDASELDARLASARFARVHGDEALAREVMRPWIRRIL